MQPTELNIELYFDGADIAAIEEACKRPEIKGVTTNPTLMRQAGVSDYVEFARDVVNASGGKPVSLAVLSDDLPRIYEEALWLSDLAEHVWVKIPVVTTSGVPVSPILKPLADQGVKLNVTALMTLDQCDKVLAAVDPAAPLILSLFSGRIADTGRDPVPVAMALAEKIRERGDTRQLWASPRELLNIFQAQEAGSDIITITEALRAKLARVGGDLEAFSRDTVKMFFDDGQAASYHIPQTLSAGQAGDLKKIVRGR